MSRSRWFPTMAILLLIAAVAGAPARAADDKKAPEKKPAAPLEVTYYYLPG